MFGYLPLSFIEEKVRDLENALFFSLSDAILKIPVCVVKLMEADELGQLWFLIPKPSQFIHAFDRTFPVKLDFFRKGRDYYIKIFGTAFLINDPEELNTIECFDEGIKQQAMENETLIVKVKISHADYIENAPGRVSAKALFNQVRNRLYRWFQLSQPAENLNFPKIPVQVRNPAVTSYLN